MKVVKMDSGCPIGRTHALRKTPEGRVAMQLLGVLRSPHSTEKDLAWAVGFVERKKNRGKILKVLWDLARDYPDIREQVLFFHEHHEAQVRAERSRGHQQRLVRAAGIV